MTFLVTATVFLSSFLLFSVQPMIAKHLLPQFGGGSSVWVIAVFVFQFLLLLGYLYAERLTAISFQKQRSIHIAVVLAILVVQFLTSSSWASPVLPPRDFIGAIGRGPEIAVITAILAGIGALYILLSTTTVVMQSWYHRATGASPYWLYRSSNVASLLAIAAYPFLIEPFLTLKTQSWVWFISFIAYVVFFLGTIARIKNDGGLDVNKKHGDARQGIPLAPPTPRSSTLYFLLLSFVPSAMMLAFTTQMTQGMAPVPFLWLLPLGLYLLSFILAFDHRFLVPTKLMVATLFLLLTVFSATASDAISLIPVWEQIAVLGLTLLLTGLVCHGELFLRRPQPQRLGRFYVLITAGGVLGGLFAGIVAPLVFNEFLEIEVVLVLSVALVARFIARDEHSRIGRFFRDRVVHVSLSIALVVFLLYPRTKATERVLHRARNFYGAILVKEDKNFRYLLNGAIVHGTQYLDPEQQFIPLSYYEETTGVGVALSWLRNLPRRRVGIVGLGAGTLAAYCDEGDEFTFYEINPLVVQVARSYFSYLERCPHAVVRIGDGRLLLQEDVSRGDQPFDLLAIDAFTDDSIPVHLLTREAFEIYRKRLTDRGILAVHISNRHLDLGPPVKRIADAFGMSVRRVTTEGKDHAVHTGSDWVLVTQNEEFLEALDHSSVQIREIPDGGDLWTDDFSNLVRVLRFRRQT